MKRAASYATRVFGALLVLCTACWADTIPISGTASTTTHADLHVYLAGLFSQDPVRLSVWPVAPNQIRDCVEGGPCHILQAISGAYFPSGSSGYDWAYVDMLFDVMSGPMPDTGGTVPEVSLVGTFSGTVAFYKCTVMVYCDTNTLEISQELIQGSKSYVVDGGYDVWGTTSGLTSVALNGPTVDLGHANSQFEFSGQAKYVPEPASLLLLASGVTAISARLRRRKRQLLSDTCCSASFHLENL